MKKSGLRGFTIVELLIVIVVIGILAAITVVAYTAVQDRARVASVNSDITNTSRKAGLVKTLTGSRVNTPDLLSGQYMMKVSSGAHRLFTVCANAAGDYGVVSEARNGNIYYSVNGGTIQQNNALNPETPCPTIGVSTPVMVFGGMPATSCAGENTTCTFSDTKTIAYGSPAAGQFFARRNQVSPLTCSNAYFGDPASGFGKACYILEY